jgi:hypothetical protein
VPTYRWIFPLILGPSSLQCRRRIKTYNPCAPAADIRFHDDRKPEFLKIAAVDVAHAIELGTLLGGSVITETIFAWPGVGRLSVQAIFNRDYPVVQAAVFILASTFVFLNFLVDVAYTWLDPRIRFR